MCVDDEDREIAATARRLLGPNAVHVLRLMDAASAVDDEQDRLFPRLNDELSDERFNEAWATAFVVDDETPDDVLMAEVERMDQLAVARHLTASLAAAGSSEPGEEGAAFAGRQDYRGNCGDAAERAAFALSVRERLPQRIYDGGRSASTTPG
ncbi:hypothetical protein [Amnibacterium sp.]|uniref:hypothetical protein n=1 Tax=Amnibacterium sp. TaxID=1872496 RepID=UPI00262D60BC|nr:hypothetical protein [Amnibacterium sp.]MCU1472561.1 hypothetical protein [Amnibacterium sp.]